MYANEPETIQPTRQLTRINGSLGSRPYVTLDLGLVRVSGEETFYEIKPEARLIQDDAGRYVPEHWCSIEAWCASNGHRCEVSSHVAECSEQVIVASIAQLLHRGKLTAGLDEQVFTRHSPIRCAQ